MKVKAIEGLRGYLSLWVLLSHVLGYCGLRAGVLNGPAAALGLGELPVQFFIIISGFVIFYLLDHKKENYLAYVARRFFRLYPLFILVFAISIPISLVLPSLGDNLGHLFETNYPRLDSFYSWWEHFRLNIIAHLFMLHGIVPDVVAPSAPAAFLGPAWSISLEWQFYLIAPLGYSLISRVASRGWRLPFTLLVVYFLFVLVRYLYPYVELGAFFPDHAHYFIYGIMSYFVYKYLYTKCSGIEWNVISIAIVLALSIGLSVRTYDVLPFVAWLVFLSCCLSVGNKGIEYVFENRLILSLGQISYGIYLIHMPVLLLSLYVIINCYGSNVTAMEVFVVAGPFTLITTVLLAALAHRFVEQPGMAVGRRYAAKFSTDKKIAND